MGSASYVQSNFQAGEFSAAYQGRLDDPDYKKALALCLNYIPTQEGTLLPRSGFKRLGNTRGNQAAKLLPFRFTAQAPYVAEHTPNVMRLWSNGLPILDTSFAAVTSVSGTTPVFVLTTQYPTVALGVPASWNTGDRILVNFSGTSDMEAAPYLGNREFILSIVSRAAGTVTLTDAVTASPLTGTITWSGSFPNFYKILDVVTPYKYPEAIRQVALSDQIATNDKSTGQVSFSEPDHRITYLHPIVSPQSLSYQQSVGPSPAPFASQPTNENMALIAEQFIDGPYLNSQSTTTPLLVDGTTGTINVTLHGWDTRIHYNQNDFVLDYTQDPTNDPYYYVSLVANNTGNALPAAAAAGSVNSHWLQLNIQRNNWVSGTTYPIGTAVTNGHYDAADAPTTEVPVYYGILGSNVGHDPASSPTYWSTSPPAWSSGTTYAAGVFVTSGGITYVSVSVPVVGTAPASAPTVWFPFTGDLNAIVSAITDIHTGWLSGPLFYEDDVGGNNSALAGAYQTNNPSRLFRMKWSPQPWSNDTTYAINDQVNYNDNIYTSLIGSNANNIPDTATNAWVIDTQTIFWTWGKIVDANQHQFQAKISIQGPDLPSNIPVWEFRFGVYSDTTGWPTCGCYHEGRLYIAGTTPNRLDAGSSDLGFNFAPTAPDGTVSDNNGIAILLNAREAETVVALASTNEGVVALTSEAEWIIAASAMNDPITPTSAQAHRTTAWSAHSNEPEQLPSALATIQKGGRRVYEYRNYIDMSSYQSRLNVVDLTRKCQHLTIGGIGQTAYQSLTQPVLWISPQSSVTFEWQPTYHSICPIGIKTPILVKTDVSGLNLAPVPNLFGIGYSRAPDVSYSAPFSFEHGLTLAGGNLVNVVSIAVQKAWQPGQENLYACVLDPATGHHYMEMMMPLFESEPSETVYQSNGLVKTYGTLASSYFVDSGITPVGCKCASDGSSATFYGMWPLVGQSVSFTIMGKYVGDFTVASDGSVTVPVSANFVLQDIGDAMNPLPNFVGNNGGDIGDNGINENTTTAVFQLFNLDANGNSINFWENQSYGFFGQFGYAFRRRGKMLRPQVGGQNGPTFAKITQNARAGIYLDGAHEVSAGTDFSSLVSLPMRKNEPADMTLLGPDDLLTGIVRGFVKDGNTFNGQICWEQTEPYPGSILSVGGFSVTEDV